MTRINERDHATLLRLQEAVCRLQDGVHDLRLPDGDASALRKSLDFGGAYASVGFVAAVEAAAFALESAEYQLQAIAVNGGDYTLLQPKSVFERAKARRAARSLPPEHPDPEPGPDDDAPRTVPTLEAANS